MKKAAYAAALVPVLVLFLVFAQGCGGTSAKTVAERSSPEAVKVNTGLSSSVSKAAPARPSSSQAQTTDYCITGLDFISPEAGYLTLGVSGDASDEFTALLATRDGGRSFSAVKKSGAPRHIDFTGGREGYGFDDAGAAFETSDGGGDWSPLSPGFLKEGRVTGLWAVSRAVVFVCEQTADGSEAFRTEDGGASWQKLMLPDAGLNYNLSDLFFLSAEKGFAIFRGLGFTGNEPKVLYFTPDGGRSWALRSKSPSFPGKNDEVGDLSLGGTGEKLDFTSEKTGFLYLSNWGEILKTADGGVDFSRLTDPNKVLVSGKPDFVSGTLGYTVFRGSQGDGLERTEDGGRTWTSTAKLDDIKSSLFRTEGAE